jgi:DNA invertase Pin-like site-specific DNA recombinase
LTGLVYSYTRFSDPRQVTGHSLERQLSLAATWAAARGLTLDSSLSMHDEGLSAFHGKHIKTGALGLFLSAVEAGRIPRGSFLLVEQFDRLSRRTPMEAFGQFSALIAAGITIVTTKDGKEFSAQSLEASPFSMFESIMPMILANQESANKSKRVTASIRSQCERWIAGTNRKLIRNGKDPLWVVRVDEVWQLIPDRVTAARRAISLYVQGYGAKTILKTLTEEKLSLTGGGPQTLQIYRLIKQRSLIGEKTLQIDGEIFNMLGYYPPILSDSEWSELESITNGRTKRIGQGVIPHILTGLRITYCGYCGRSMAGQNLGTRRKNSSDLINDGHRRIICAGYHYDGCKVNGTSSVAPFERALMDFCSDIINLKSLYGSDRTSIPLKTLTQAKQELIKVEKKLERLTDAMLASEEGGVPKTFAKRARELEFEQQKFKLMVEAAERDLASTIRTDITGTDEIWKALTKGVLNQEPDARMKARRLVAETFSKILIFSRGVRPDETPSKNVSMTLLAKGGVEKLLHIDYKGKWILGENYDGTQPDYDHYLSRNSN